MRKFTFDGSETVSNIIKGNTQSLTTFGIYVWFFMFRIQGQEPLKCPWLTSVQTPVFRTGL